MSARPSLFATLSLAGLLLTGLGGCQGAPRWASGSKGPTEAQVQASLQSPENYVYFPGYEIYYNRTQGYYVFWDGTKWQDRFDPPAEVPAAVLLASPSVPMTFHDEPARHHAEVVRLYPRSWGTGR